MLARTAHHSSTGIYALDTAFPFIEGMTNTTEGPREHEE
jgi:hypothetical protein